LSNHHIAPAFHRVLFSAPPASAGIGQGGISRKALKKALRGSQWFEETNLGLSLRVLLCVAAA
jgi:hypothetical protein